MGKENRFFIIILFSISIILIVNSVFLVLNHAYKKPLQSIEYEVFFIVGGGKIGVDVDNSRLTFGRTSPGGPEMTRPVLITNNYDFPILVEVFVSENIADVIVLDFNYTVDSRKNLSVPIKLAVPEDFPLGDYTGEIRFDLYRLKE